MVRLAAAVAVGLIALVSGGIYPDGHFDTVHRMTTDNFDGIVKVGQWFGNCIF